MIIYVDGHDGGSGTSTAPKPATTCEDTEPSKWEGRGLARFRFRVPFPAPARQTVRAVLPHTAYRRSSPAAFGPPVPGGMTVPSRLIRPRRSGESSIRVMAHPQALRRLPRLDNSRS